MNNVIGCQFLDNGNRRVWHFRNTSQVVEYPGYPLRMRFQFFDAYNRTIRDKALQSEMKKAIELYRKIRGIK
ncbi:hypothetical protein NLN82_22675 [Citrobacter portucalensis]|uniref:hypothetical protein n=1 Tax=Citrobacter portucalensis TaxID=1639133 RepID=UPI00226B1031|nr:hypothetical protein [Citrobacter portucalensis]MCX9038832.1 hypothetical protein [Citrobacter portucalensis]